MHKADRKSIYEHLCARSKEWRNVFSNLHTAKIEGRIGKRLYRTFYLHAEKFAAPGNGADELVLGVDLTIALLQTMVWRDVMLARRWSTEMRGMIDAYVIPKITEVVVVDRKDASLLKVMCESSSRFSVETFTFRRRALPMGPYPQKLDTDSIAHLAIAKFSSTIKSMDLQGIISTAPTDSLKFFTNESFSQMKKLVIRPPCFLIHREIESPIILYPKPSMESLAETLVADVTQYVVTTDTDRKEWWPKYTADPDPDLTFDRPFGGDPRIMQVRRVGLDPGIMPSVKHYWLFGCEWMRIMDILKDDPYRRGRRRIGGLTLRFPNLETLVFDGALYEYYRFHYQEFPPSCTTLTVTSYHVQVLKHVPLGEDPSDEPVYPYISRLCLYDWHRSRDATKARHRLNVIPLQRFLVESTPNLKELFVEYNDEIDPEVSVSIEADIHRGTRTYPTIIHVGPIPIKAMETRLTEFDFRSVYGRIAMDTPTYTRDDPYRLEIKAPDREFAKIDTSAILVQLLVGTDNSTEIACFWDANENRVICEAVCDVVMRRDIRIVYLINSTAVVSEIATKRGDTTPYEFILLNSDRPFENAIDSELYMRKKTASLWSPSIAELRRIDNIDTLPPGSTINGILASELSIGEEDDAMVIDV